MANSIRSGSLQRNRVGKKVHGEHLAVQTYFGLGKEQVAVFVQHGLGPFQQVAGDSFKLIIHCAQEGEGEKMLIMTHTKKRGENLLSLHRRLRAFSTSLIVFRGVGSSLVEMIRQQSMQRVLERVERGVVVWVEH